MKQKGPVFIVGPGRSGTSLLYRLLQKHSAFKPNNCAAGVDLTETRIFDAPQAAYDRVDSAAVGTFPYMLSNEHFFDKFLAKSGRRKAWQSMMGASLLPGSHRSFIRFLLRSRAMRGLSWRLYAGPAMARDFFEVAQQARGAERILEKTPSHLHHIPEITCTHPDCNLICMVRHPIDIFTSYRRRLAAERESGASPEQLAWLNVTAEEFCVNFSADGAIIRGERDRNDGVFLCVRYEDFIQHPNESVQRILFFVGEDYEAQCVAEDETDRLYWNVDPHLFGRINTETKDWREYIEQDEAEYIETTLELPMTQLGYRRYT